MTRLSVWPIAALALFAGLPPEALAQAVTRPTVTASAGVLRATSFYDGQGDAFGSLSTFTSTAFRLGVEFPVRQRAERTVSLGARFALASYRIAFEDDAIGGSLHVQNVDIYGRLGDVRASALFGVSLNLGPDGYDLFGDSTISDRFYINSDGQHALVGQLRGETAAGRARLFAGFDGSLTVPMDTRVLYFDSSFPPEASVTSYDVTVDNGDLYSFQVGASAPAGPVMLGLAAFYAARTGGTIRYTNGIPPDFPTGFREARTLPLRTGYASTLGLIPSIEYRPTGTALTVRVEGSFSDLYTMENVPVGITLTGENGPVTRPALTVSVGVGL